MISENEERAQGRVLYTRVDLRRLGIRISNSTLLRLEAAGKWPKRVHIGDHSVAWLRDEVDAHISALADQRGQR
jgi:predicted DNA-binding transcriptional regulator AlpA